MQGRIIKGIGGFYYVASAGGNIYECRAKGIFRKEKLRHRNLVTPAAQRYEKMDNPNLLYYR